MSLLRFRAAPPPLLSLSLLLFVYFSTSNYHNNFSFLIINESFVQNYAVLNKKGEEVFSYTFIGKIYFFNARHI